MATGRLRGGRRERIVRHYILYKTYDLIQIIDRSACAEIPPWSRTTTRLTPPARPARPPVFSPLYRQIKDLLVRSLDRGEWKPGELIPSEIELAARFQVSQGTVRKAVDELAAENLLVRRQGKGTFVATHHEPRAQFRFLRVIPDEGEPAAAAAASSNAGACAPRPTSRACWCCAPAMRSSTCGAC